ncbi:MAG: helix-turn-helix transcriptional regulator [Spirochaetes bacterium]|nr:helix-turn-helix transcriptional regulator [Spirochaetota bacterium]
MESGSAIDPFYENDVTQFTERAPLMIRRSVTVAERAAVRPHFHGTLELVWFYSGTGGRVIIDGKPHPYTKEQAIFIKPYAMHAYELHSLSQRFLLVKFDTARFVELFSGSQLERDARIFTARLAHAVPVQRIPPSAIRSLAQCSTQDLFASLAALISLTQSIRTLPSSSVDAEASSAFSRAISFMEKHYNEKITLAAAAAEAGVSKFHFAHTFPKLYGMSFVDFLNRIRLARAENLLRYSDKSISDIARSVGFFDAAYFHKVFKKHRGERPKDFRSGFRS